MGPEFNSNSQLIVKKFGGATLSSPEKIKQVAFQLYQSFNKGQKVVAVVSAMGNTTNALIKLAHEISPHPSLREMDMLLSTGERVSMSLLSMALQDLNCKAISFTGSQAGILTNESHSNAIITDVKPHRILNAIANNQVVILAGFQGMSPLNKEITTLGRGGSDTTAVSIAAAIGANWCEILKDVPAIFTADPKIVSNAKPINQLTYTQLLNMTFWGAKVLHFRSVELSQKLNVPLYIGPAHSHSEGTWITGEELKMNNPKLNENFEATQILAISSYDEILCLNHTKNENQNALNDLQEQLSDLEIYFPQILYVEPQKIYFTGPQESMLAIKNSISQLFGFTLDKQKVSSVTATCTSNSTSQSIQKIFASLKNNNIYYHKIIISGQSVTIFVDSKFYHSTITCLHQLI